MREIRSMRGVSLVELLVTIGIVGCGIVMIINGYHRYVKNINNVEIRLRAAQVLENIKEEIMVKKYKDNSPNMVFGPEPGEIQKIRSTLNDIDDYNELFTEVVDSHGVPPGGYENYFIRVDVYNFNIEENKEVSRLEDTGTRKIVIQVLYKDRVINKVEIIKTDSEKPYGNH
ncbi:MAG: hypothetical protein AB1765_02285 [Candidatus Hydrogenedentota bacterium]